MVSKKQIAKERKAQTEALEDACERGDVPEVVRLLNSGLDVDTPCTVRRTPLHLAVKECNATLTELLLERGANPAALDYQSSTPLHLLFGKTEELVRITSLLLAAGAPVNARDTYGSTALHKICKSPAVPPALAVEVVALLLEAGAEVDARDNASRTPLWYAAGYGSLETVKVLIQGGANPRLGMGAQTPAQAAEEDGHRETADYLKSVGG